MKVQSSKTSVIIITALYVFSLLSFVIPMHDDRGELNSVVQLMHKLQSFADTEKEGFKQAFCESIDSLRAVAGVNVVFIKKMDDHSGDHVNFSIFFVKSPCLLPTDLSHNIECLELVQKISEIDFFYKSPILQPDIPPPKLS